MPRVEEVIITREKRGYGTPHDPAREITVVYDLDGGFIAKHDDWEFQNCELVLRRDREP